MRAVVIAANRLLAVTGRISMYRLTLLALAVLTVASIGVSLFGLVAPGPGELLAAIAVLGGACAVADVVGHRIVRRAWRPESTFITAAILVFVLRPTLDPAGLAGLAIAGIAASASKYLLVWRGRHVFNPAALGATVLTVVSLWAPQLGASAWWVGTPVLAVPLVLLGILVVLRTERPRLVVVFLVVAVATAFIRTSLQYRQAGLDMAPGELFWQILWSSPFLFLGAFMLTEPLTLPPRRGQQLAVAALTGILAGWPISLGEITLGQERALLVGNLLAFALAFAARGSARLILVDRRELTPTVRELTFRADGALRFAPGQFLELEVPHARPDARGTRREFSLVSAPEELPLVSIALRESASGDGRASSYKRALAQVAPGDALPVTGVWGDFVLPARAEAPVLMMAAGIGVTPFVSQLRHARLAAQQRDIVLVYVAPRADELAFRDEIAASGMPVVVYTPDEPPALPAHWRWAGGSRIDAEGLVQAVPDIAARHAYVSGPPTLIAALTPALRRARSLTTDAFAGY
ncbi:FAD-dependent oxidoreductase [Microbacterium sp. No. 7]|uniref:FAD-dependent oxidoreductase n=1 Tax=Microbacterium sp. No. 7 TaxID=1714373 RepID=UPI0006D22995|nr:FAD-dependent oxidoreductase [Microbacterium sp. No. 7]ALJ19816.1 flavodoxin reductase [Microbacterium sp. No. 7]